MLIRVDLFLILSFSVTRIPIDYLNSNIQLILTEADKPEFFILKDLTEEENIDKFKQKQKEFIE